MLLCVKTEKQLQDYLRRAAKAAGILYSKLESRSTNGWPDCILIANGRVVFIELKTPRGTGSLSPIQNHVITQIRAHGGEVHVISAPSEVDALVKVLLQ